MGALPLAAKITVDKHTTAGRCTSAHVAAGGTHRQGTVLTRLGYDSYCKALKSVATLSDVALS